MFDSISISEFFSISNSFLLTDLSEMKLQTGHSPYVLQIEFLLFSLHEIICSSGFGCFRLGTPVYISDLVTSKKQF